MPPKPPNTVPTGASFLEILLLVARYGKTQRFSKFIGIGQHLECSPPVSPTSLRDISYSYLGKQIECSLGRHRNCYGGSTLSAPFDSTRLHWKHHECSLGKHLESACSHPTGEIPILQEESALLGSTSSSPCLFFSHLRHFVISSALLGGITTAILGSTLSAPFDSTRLHWKHHECSLGKHLESACAHPTGAIPYFIGSERGALLHRALTL